MLHSSGYTMEKMLVHEVHNLREAQAQGWGWDMQLDNREGIKLFQFPRLLATGSVLTCTAFQLELKLLKIEQHSNTFPAQSKDLVPKNTIQSSKTSHF